jgi:hypothetical protein
VRIKSIISVAASVQIGLFLLWGVRRLVLIQRVNNATAQHSLAQDTLEATEDTSRALL